MTNNSKCSTKIYDTEKLVRFGTFRHQPNSLNVEFSNPKIENAAIRQRIS